MSKLFSLDVYTKAVNTVLYQFCSFASGSVISFFLKYLKLMGKGEETFGEAHV